MAVSPFAATRSQPTKTRFTRPLFITVDAILSQIRVVSMPAPCSSKAVSLAPCSSGLVSSQYTRKSVIPCSSATYMGAVAVPYFAVANVPALQWVRMPSPGLSRPKPISPMRRLIATSSSRIACASRKRISLISSTGLPACASRVRSIRSNAQNRLTAVGREEARYFFCSRKASRKVS